MIGRLLYHVFWNFYDYLGSYLLIGALTCLPLFVMVYAVAALAPFLTSGVAGALVLGLLVLLIGALIAAGAAGTLNFATIAARDEPARFPDFKGGARALLKPTAKALAVIATFYLVDFIAAWFYLTLGGRMGNPALRWVVFVLGILFAWLALLGGFYAVALFGAVGRSPGLGFREHAKRAFIGFVVAPSLWIPAGILFIIGSLICFVSVVGIVFWIPMTATIAATAMELCAQYIAHLSEEKGKAVDASPRRLRLAASKSFLEAEAAKPQRTFRELIRPWEM